MGRRLAKLVGPIEQRLWGHSPVVLMYHRVARRAEDLWGICVEPKRFAEQIEALKQVREVVPLDRVLAWRKDGGSSGRPLAVITFDDGYRDALDEALPILEKKDCPATVYVTTGLVGTTKAFWWDELARLIMKAPPTSPPLSLMAGEAIKAWPVPDDPDGRRKVCAKVRRWLRDLEPEVIEDQMGAVSYWSGGRRGAPDADRAMTPEEVGRLSQSLVTVGAHTVNHPSLPRLSPDAQLREISKSRRACEEWTGAPVEHFAYPFGHYDGSSVAAVRGAGFRSACATTPGVVRPWTDPQRLPRISPGTMDGEALTRLLG
jgi:peptidoglycan/xylan/chitin deacetylase (PgdA/CDA1 family)